MLKENLDGEGTEPHLGSPGLSSRNASGSPLITSDFRGRRMHIPARTKITVGGEEERRQVETEGKKKTVSPVGLGFGLRGGGVRSR